MTNILQKWWKDQNGATALEYSLLAAGISLAIVVAVFLLGDELGAFFDSLGGSLER